MTVPTPNQKRIQAEVAKNRLQILHRLERWLELPMTVLGLAWLALLVIDLAWGLSPLEQKASTAIWIVFIADFLLRFTLAPRKLRYLRRNWLTVIALILPALRVLRFARLFRMLGRLRGLQLVRILSSINRGMKAAGKAISKRGIGYVVLLTAMVTLAGAAGMFYFEHGIDGEHGLNDFWTALWWTAMIMTTMGSEYWPHSIEGRVLCLLLAIYAFAVFGYVTGAIATYFVGRDAGTDDSAPPAQESIDALRREIASLREELDMTNLKSRGGGGM